MRKGIGAFVDQAKGIETRKLRAARMAESLMLAMEGEEEAATHPASSLFTPAAGLERAGMR